MLDFIYYPVSVILWCWHKVFGAIMGETNGLAWALSIVFLVFTLRAILFKPFVSQVRSMRKMQEFAPQMKAIQKKYSSDRQRQAQEMQKLQRENGFNPVMGCLPILLQIPVFIGLNVVLRGFKQGATSNYFFKADDVHSYLQAKIFGADLSKFIFAPEQALASVNVDRLDQILVSIPLMLAASFATHITARHSVARQNPASATGQTAIMNKLSLYIFPLGVLVAGCILPMGLLLYWLSNNVWTLFQQRLVYTRIDKEEEEKKQKAIEQRKSLAPKAGAKPKPGAKPQARKATQQVDGVAGATAEAVAGTAGSTATQTEETSNGAAAEPKKPAGSTGGGGNGKRAPAKAAGTKPTGTKPGTKPGGTKATGTKATGNGAPAGAGSDRSRKKK